MRVLEFDVINQELIKNRLCDFDNIVKNSGSMIAKFNISKEWSGCKIAASFVKLGDEFPVLIENGVCEIPQKALTWNEFSVQIVGLKDGKFVKTNKLIIKQEG